jgi:DNA-binding response OmpR family regulator
MKILFVDDEPWLSIPLRAVLEAKGFECISKSDMTAAWEYLEENQVEVLVTDIMMPGGKRFPEIDSQETGFHLVSKARVKWPKLSIICLSVINNINKIDSLKRKSVYYLHKGETTLETAAMLIESKATGVFKYKGKK